MSIRYTIRNLLKNKKYSSINLVGMTTGMACCFLILTFLRYEYRFDTVFPEREQLYRVRYHAKFSETPLDLSRVPAPMASLMPDYFPQIDYVARLFPRSISVREPNKEQQFEVGRALFADSTVQEVLGFEFIQGDPKKALHEPYTLILTNETAERIFGTTEVLGKQLRLANAANFTVRGVIRKLPEQSHLRLEMLVPFRNIPDVELPSARHVIEHTLTSNWLASYTHTYVRLKKNASLEATNRLFTPFLKKYGDPNFVPKQDFSLFPVADIHLHSKAQDEVVARANPAYLRTFGIVGFLVLLIASINFINLSTAVYLDRSKEVAVRKVLGAKRGSLITQFLSETMLLSGVAFVLALGILSILIPLFNAQNDKQISFHLMRDWPLSLNFFGIFVLTGLLAGLYPALFASRFRPVEVFKRSTTVAAGAGGQWFRKSLITLQFSVSIALVCCTLIMINQLSYWKNISLGFDTQQIISIPLSSANINTLLSPGDSTLRTRMNAFDEQVLQKAGVEAVTLASAMPGLGGASFPITTDKIRLEDNVMVPCLSVDYDFAETFRLKYLAGRDFDQSYGTDHLSSFIINETAVKTLGWSSPQAALGQKMTKGGKPGLVVGVVNNFNTAGLQNPLSPVVMEVAPGSFTAFAIRLNAQDRGKVIPEIEKMWQRFFPEKAFTYTYLQDDLQGNYQEEARLMQLSADFAIVAIFLACFGLFGLVDFTVRQRTKEIGVRKVLGASISSVMVLLSSDFLKLVLISLCIATPLAWWAMTQWLSDFAYRIAIPWWVFIVAGIAALVVAFLTVSVQTLRAAVANPVKSLRSE